MRLSSGVRHLVLMTKQMLSFEDLVGRHVSCWVGIEMAAAQGEDAFGIVWAEAPTGHLQFFEMEAQLSDGSVLLIDARLDENGNHYGLFCYAASHSLELFEAREGDFLRGRIIDELPTGKISQVELQRSESGQVTAAMLRIAAVKVALACGEIIFDGKQFIVVRPEEFVLVGLTRVDA